MASLTERRPPKKPNQYRRRHLLRTKRDASVNRRPTGTATTARKALIFHPESARNGVPVGADRDPDRNQFPLQDQRVTVSQDGARVRSLRP
jgi:hypothetical protein